MNNVNPGVGLDVVVEFLFHMLSVLHCVQGYTPPLRSVALDNSHVSLLIVSLFSSVIFSST
jgi:hypothetical protein